MDKSAQLVSKNLVQIVLLWGLGGWVLLRKRWDDICDSSRRWLIHSYG